MAKVEGLKIVWAMDPDSTEPPRTRKVLERDGDTWVIQEYEIEPREGE